MSKYKVGDKFVIEVDKAFGFMGGDPLYTIKGFNALVFDDYGLDKLQKLNPKLKIEDIDDMLAEHDLKKEAYYKDLNDAWELARRLFGYSCDTKLYSEDLKEIFGSACEMDILRNNTPQEALAKIEEYEESKAIKVGDVVKVDGTNKDCGIVIAIDEIQKKARLMYADTSFRVNEWYLADLKKTGRHIDIEHLLEQIRGNE